MLKLLFFLKNFKIFKYRDIYYYKIRAVRKEYERFLPVMWFENNL